MVRVIVFALIAVGWWLAAPDRFTAGARTAAGTAGRAAGTGLRDHWRAGRSGRVLGRTARRDRWHKRGGWWRKLLGLEHGAVVTGKAVKGAGKLTGAAVRPVPGAVRDGWRRGQDRHQARTAGRPVPVALDPPWWHRTAPVPAPVPAETGQDSGTTRQDSPTGQDEDHAGPLNVDPTADPFEKGDRVHHPAGDGVVEAITPNSFGGPPVVRVRLDDGQLVLTDQRRLRPPTDPSTGTSPAGATPTDNPGGIVSPTPFGAELDDLTSVQDFAVKVADMAEESDFAQLVEFCKHASDETRDFGADMAGDVAEFEEIASKIGDLLSELVDAAQHVRDRSAELIGG